MGKDETDLRELEAEIDIAFKSGVEEFRIDSFSDDGIFRGQGIALYFEKHGYDTQMLGRRDVDRGAEFSSRYSIIVRQKKQV